MFGQTPTKKLLADDQEVTYARLPGDTISTAEAKSNHAGSDMKHEDTREQLLDRALTELLSYASSLKKYADAHPFEQAALVRKLSIAIQRGAGLGAVRTAMNTLPDNSLAIQKLVADTSRTRQGENLQAFRKAYQAEVASQDIIGVTAIRIPGAAV